MSKNKGKKASRPAQSAPKPATPTPTSEPAAAKSPPVNPAPTVGAICSLLTDVQSAWKRELLWMDASGEAPGIPEDITFSSAKLSDPDRPDAESPVDVVSLLTPAVLGMEPARVLQLLKTLVADDGLIVIRVTAQLTAKDNELQIPVCNWVAALHRMSYTVSLRYDNESGAFDIFASVEKDHPAHSLSDTSAAPISFDGKPVLWCLKSAPSGDQWSAESLIYVCNYDATILSLRIEMECASEQHPDLYLGDLKLRHVQSQKQKDAYLHHWGTAHLPSGSRELSVRVSGEAIQGSLRVHVEECEREAFLVSLPFDHYQRYRMAASILEAVLPESSTVLDVGGTLGYFRSFLPAYGIHQVDLVAEDAPNSFGYDGKRLPWDDGQFDAVVCIDTLEHIPPEQRKSFVHELCRVSRGVVVLSCPFHEPNVVDAEAVLRDFLASQFNRRDRFLQEHEEYQLPDVGAISECFEEEAWSVTGLPNGYLPRWLLMQLLEFSLSSSPEMHEGRARLHALYNQNYYENDNRFPAYRIAMVATREPLSAEKRDALATMISSGPDQPTGDVWNVASLTASIAHMRALKEKDAIIEQRSQQITDLLSHVSNLESRLKDMQADHSKLLGHVSNLEKMLSESQEHTQQVTQHAQNLQDAQKGFQDAQSSQQQHITNLESLVSERDKSVAGLREFLTMIQTRFAGKPSGDDRATEDILAGIAKTEATIEALSGHLNVDYDGPFPNRLDHIHKALVELLHETIELRDQKKRQQKDGVVRVLRTSTLPARAKQS